MFWKKKKATPNLHRKRQQKLKLEPGKLSRKEIIENIEELVQGDALSYRLSKACGHQIAVVEFNRVYPWRGRKYMLSTQALVEDKACGEKALVLESDGANKIAAWLSRHRALSYPTGLALSGEEVTDSVEQ